MGDKLKANLLEQTEDLEALGLMGTELADDIRALLGNEKKLAKLRKLTAEEKDKDLDPATITPGVRKLVIALRKEGFDTVDSGDGVENVLAGMEGALDVPHVHIRTFSDKLVDEAQRLNTVLRDLLTTGSEFSVQATYSPQDGVSTISVFGATDSMLRKKRSVR